MLPLLLLAGSRQAALPMLLLVAMLPMQLLLVAGRRLEFGSLVIEKKHGGGPPPGPGPGPGPGSEVGPRAPGTGPGPRPGDFLKR